ncbi:MAG: PKD domain-containing protein, partial [Thermoplasmatota archaeon]
MGNCSHLEKHLTILVSIALLSVALFPLVTLYGTAATLYVGDGSAYSSIQAAINDAAAGDTIYVHDGVYAENIVIDKSLTLIGESRNNTIISGGGTGDTIHITVDSVDIQSLCVEQSGSNTGDAGIDLDRVYRCTISNVCLRNNHHGIYMLYGGNNSVEYCEMFQNRWGIYMYGCSGMTISENDILHNYRQGIYMRICTDNDILVNTVTNNIDSNVYLRASDSNQIRGNNISSSEYGIYLLTAHENVISSNFVTDNDIGIQIEGGDNNIVHRNNFIYNALFNAKDSSTTNNWDYEAHGNFWDDYDGSDSNGDGIGDTPYDVPGGGANQDQYPLMNATITDTVPPVIESVTAFPSPQELNGHTNISCIVTDNLKVGDVRVNVTYPDGSSSVLVLKEYFGDRYYIEVNCTSYGQYNYTVTANDVFNNTNSSALYNFTVSLLPEPPTITDITDAPDPQEYPQRVTISCNATDNAAMGTVQAVVSREGSPIGNYTMNGENIDDKYNGLYRYYFTPPSMGEYTYHIWAEDVNHNSVQSTSRSFTVEDTTPPGIANISAQPPLQDLGNAVNVSCQVTDNHQVSEAWLHVTYPDDSTTNTSMTADDGIFSLNQTYTMGGTYQYTITALDASGNSNTSTPQSFIITAFPSVSFTYDPSVPTDWDVVSFTSTSTDADGSIVNHSWTIRKKSTGSLILTSYQSAFDHNFTDNGEYLVTLTVTDDQGATNTTTETVTIHNIPPVADFSFSPTTATVGEPVSFYANPTDKDGTITYLAWAFGDGHVFEGNPSEAANTTHVYHQNGLLNVTLNVTDNDYDSDEITRQITVIDIKPPSIDNVSGYPNPQEVRGRVNITCHITDDVAVDAAQINVTGIDPYNDHITKTAAMHSNDNGTTWWYEAPYNTTGTGYHDTGNYSATIRAVDPSGNSNTSSPYVFTIFQPAMPPEVHAVWDTPADKQYGFPVNISCNASDNVALVAVGVNVTYPDDGSINVSMNPFSVDEDNNGIYFYNQTYPMLGNYSYQVWAIDINDNLNISSGHTFSIVDTMPPQLDNLSIMPAVQERNGTVNISSRISDNLAMQNVSIRVVHANETIAYKQMNVSSLYYLQRNYSQPGVYTVIIHANDTLGNTARYNDSFAITTFPIANFSYTPSQPVTHETVNFTDDSSDPDGSIEAWHWDFGDGNTSSQQHPSHSYTADGSYTVTLTVTDNHGATASNTRQAEVQNVPPTAAFTYTPEQPTDIEAVRFNASSSNDSDGIITTYEWNFGDGTTGSGMTPSHQYANNSVYEVTLTVTDDNGATDTASHNITIYNVPPVPDFVYNINSLYIGVANNGSYDPDGDIVNWTWRFGDGTVKYGNTTKTHQYSQAGSYMVSLTVTDDDGDSNTTSKRISVGVFLAANFTYGADPASSEPLPFYDNSSHPETWHWDFGDGTTSTETNPTHIYSIGNYYNVTLTVTNGSENDSMTQTIPVDTTIHIVKNTDNVVNYIPWLGDDITASTLAGQIGSDVMPEGSVV